MSIETRNSDHMAHMLEAILRSPVTAEAVARTLLMQTAERAGHATVPDLKTRRASSAVAPDADPRDAGPMRGGQTSPWARSG
jgi:hypothetical protein